MSRLADELCDHFSRLLAARLRNALEAQRLGPAQHYLNRHLPLERCLDYVYDAWSGGVELVVEVAGKGSRFSVFFSVMVRASRSVYARPQSRPTR